MKERGIIMQGESVRAIFDGRKTQTRRLYRSRSCDNVDDPKGALFSFPTPYGSPGDRLWVKESWLMYESDKHNPWPDLPSRRGPDGIAFYREGFDRSPPSRWRSPMCMPRWASRLTLEITEVRVQRAQEISGDDAAAEGISVPRCGCEVCRMSIAMCPADQSAHIEEFATLWDSINGKRASWASNPWVWAITFRRVEVAR